MKKTSLIIPQVLAILFFISCSLQESEKKEFKDGIWVEKINYDTRFMSKFKKRYFLRKSFKNRRNLVSYGEAYNVYFPQIKEPVKVLPFYDNLGLERKFKITSYLIEMSFKKKEEKISLGYIYRKIQNEKYTIIEIVSPITGKIISYDLKGLVEAKYLKFRRCYYKIKAATIYQSKMARDQICFTTFNACIQHASDGDGSASDAALCDFFPCNTMAYVACNYMKISGYIENSDNFVGCGACGTIYGELKQEL